jgi:prepilin-type N-terminal cleavage/methylation domain-containing protein
MLYRSGTQRPGVTLLEVLTAIFIMGIGMLALLTLFPLGALSMARAIRDDRAATIAANASAVAATFDLRNDTNVNTEINAYAPTDTSRPSNVVLVDPHFNVLPGVRPLGEFPAGSGTTTPGIRRATPTFATTAQLRNLYFTLQDEIEFDTLGNAKGFPASVNRPGTYSYAYLVRRPRHASRELVELSVIVYSQRAIDTFDAEPTYTGATGTANSTSLAFTWAAPKPDIRKGTWIVDTTLVAGQIVNGHVYRVENVTDSAGNTMTLDLDRPLKANVTTFAVLKNAIAVVERGTTWVP